MLFRSSYVKHGEVRWQNVAAGAAIGGVIGLTGGAATGVLVAGSATASTAAVIAGANTLALTVSGGGLVAGGKVVVDNIQRAIGNSTVLGSYPGYLKLADQLKARVFSVPSSVWNNMTRAQQWAMNQKFLDESIKKGHQFILSANAYGAKEGTFFFSEIQYLLNNGYKIVDEGWRLIK